MKTNYLFLALIGFVLLVAVITNPTPQQHKDALKLKLSALMQESISKNMSESDNAWEQAGSALGFLFGGAFIDEIIANVVTSDNYVLFSTTKITWQGDSKVIGIGAFGNVFLSSKLDEAVNENLLNE